MKYRNRIELVTLADGVRLVRLNGNNIQQVRTVEPNLVDGTVTLVIDADFMSRVDDGEMMKLIVEEQNAEVSRNRKMLLDAYADGSVIEWARKDDPSCGWMQAHKMQAPHDFDWEQYVYRFPPGSKSDKALREASAAQIDRA